MTREAVSRTGGNDAHGHSGITDGACGLVDGTVAATGENGVEAAVYRLTGQPRRVVARCSFAHFHIYAAAV